MLNLCKLRKQAGLTQRQLGEQVGVSVQTIIRYENGTREPRYAELRKLCEIFNVTVDEFRDSKNNTTIRLNLVMSMEPMKGGLLKVMKLKNEFTLFIGDKGEIGVIGMAEFKDGSESEIDGFMTKIRDKLEIGLQTRRLGNGKAKV